MLIRLMNPFSELEKFHRGVFSSLFDSSNWTPDVELKDEEKQFVIEVEVPGTKAENLDVSIENGVLLIRGEKKSGNYNKSFTRSFSLPDNTDPEKTSALLENGVLKIKIQKVPERIPKKIYIKVQT